LPGEPGDCAGVVVRPLDLVVFGSAMATAPPVPHRQQLKVVR